MNAAANRGKILAEKVIKASKMAKPSYWKATPFPKTDDTTTDEKEDQTQIPKNDVEESKNQTSQIPQNEVEESQETAEAKKAYFGDFYEEFMMLEADEKTDFTDMMNTSFKG